MASNSTSNVLAVVIVGAVVLFLGITSYDAFNDRRAPAAAKPPEVMVNVVASADLDNAVDAITSSRPRNGSQRSEASSPAPQRFASDAATPRPTASDDRSPRADPANSANDAADERAKEPVTTAPPVVDAPVVIAPASWSGVRKGAAAYGRPNTAICEDGLKRGLVIEMPSTEAITLNDGSELPVGSGLRVRVGDVRLGNGDDPTVARFELASVQWGGAWQTVNATAYRIPFARRRSVGSSALKGAAIGAAAGTVVSLVFKTDLAPSILVGAAAGAMIGAGTAGSSNIPCIDPSQTKLGFTF